MPAGNGADRSPVSLVFGHTHKPFQDRLLVDGYAEPVQLWNSGGWVLDDLPLAPTQGAAAIIIDDDANVASLRLFNHPPSGSIGKVRALGCAGVDPADNPLVPTIKEAVRSVPSWEEFSAVVTTEIAERARFVRDMFFDPTKNPRIAPEGTTR